MGWALVWAWVSVLAPGWARARVWALVLGKVLVAVVASDHPWVREWARWFQSDWGLGRVVEGCRPVNRRYRVPDQHPRG